MEPWGNVKFRRPPPRDYFYSKLRQWDAFWRGFGFEKRLELEGQRVLDVGCGYGSFTVRAALDGAHTTGIDIDGRKLRVGWTEAQRLLHDPGKVTLYNADAAQFAPVIPFDLIFTHETFEHVDDLPLVLVNLHKLVVKGGRLFASWGPLWPSLFGGHYWIQKHVKGMEIPWSHRMFTARGQRPGVNQLSYQDYVDVIEASPWTVEYWATNVGGHPAYKAFRALARVPGLRDAFTQNVSAVLRRDD